MGIWGRVGRLVAGGDEELYTVRFRTVPETLQP